MSVIKVVVSGAAGQIAYSLLPLICNGLVFGPECHIDLRLLDIPMAQEAMEGVKMELQDCAFHLVDAITPTSDLKTAFQDVDVAILLGGFPRKVGMERKDLIEKNVTIFKAQGQAIEQHANRHVKVLVVANPANTNCLIAMEHAPSIPRSHFTALTRLDHERLRSFLVERINQRANTPKVTSNDVSNCIIWGNHSSTQVPDVTHVKVYKNDLLSSYIQDETWITQELVSNVQQRGAAIIKARKLSSAMSAAAAIGAHVRDWWMGSNEIVSMAIPSDGNAYHVPEGLIYSFPVHCKGKGEYEIVNGLSISPRIANMMEMTAKELMEEKTDAMEILARTG